MKKLLSLLLALMMVLSLVACGGGNSSSSTTTTPADTSTTTPSTDKVEEPDPFLIGITTFSTATVFSRNAREVLKKEIEARGGEYIDNVATDTLSRDDAINNFISQGVDAIILLSGDVSECEESLKAASDAGILIGSCDAGYVDCVDIYTSSDNYAIGEQVLGALSNAMGGEGKILQIYNDIGSMDRKRKGGAADIVAQNDKLSIDYGMVYAWPDYYEDIKSKMEAIILSDGDSINGVFATFDGVGLAALQAIREAGLEAQMPIVGVDGEAEALNEIAKPDSAYYATVIQSWDDCGGVCVNEIFNALKGGQISTAQVYVPGVLVTKENVAEIQAQYPELFEMN